MIRHVALFTWKPETTGEQKQQLLTELSALPRLVPGVRDYRFGADAAIVTGTNADFAITADFDDADAYLVYRDHPAHVAMIENTVKPIVAQRVSAQFEF
jgi:hypothetical protein